MSIDTTKELNKVLKDIDAKIQYIESCPNRAFALIEHDTLILFHWFNLCLNQFLKKFDCHNVSQILQKERYFKTLFELREKYFQLLKEQILFLEEFIDLDNKSLKYVSPINFDEDDETDILEYYMSLLKDEIDEDGELLYSIDNDDGTHSIVVDENAIPIDLYIFRSDKLNCNFENGIIGIFFFLKRVRDLMYIICSYSDNVLFDYIPKHEDTLDALEKELRQYAKERGKMIERKLKRVANNLNTSKNALLTTDIWVAVMEEEDYLFDLAISGRLLENKETRFERIGEAQRYLLSNNSSLLQSIKDTAIDGELFDIRCSVEKHNLFKYLDIDNLNLFYELVVRRNIIQREMYPEDLRTKYEEWVNSSEKQESEENNETGLSEARLSKLDEIIGILKKGNWKEPASADSITLLLNVVFGKEITLLDDGDKPLCDKMWAFVEGGSGDRMEVVPANLAGFFKEENLLIGSPKTISDDLFGKYNNQSNNINKGKPNLCSNVFKEIIPFLTKYTNKIMRNK